MQSPHLYFVLALATFLVSAVPQKNTFPTPPASMNKEPHSTEPTGGAPHVDFARAQFEADELSRTAQTIPADVISVRKGMLPKDTIQKLKQIEKLSKHLRAELNP